MRNRTDLIDAARAGNLQMVQFLLADGEKARIDQRDEDSGNTALMVAASYGYAQIVSVLLEAGAAIDLQNNYGHTALSMAANIVDRHLLMEDRHRLPENYVQTVDVLLKAKPIIDLRVGCDSQTALISSVDLSRKREARIIINESDKTIVRMLLAAGAQVNVKDNWGDTALTCAKGLVFEGIIIRHLREKKKMESAKAEEFVGPKEKSVESTREAVAKPLTSSSQTQFYYRPDSRFLLTFEDSEAKKGLKYLK
jgi:ankyrin repeat protein